MKITTLIAFACLAALVAGSAIILTDNFGAYGFALVAAVVIAGWWFAAWWFADDQAAFGKPLPGRVTFLMVVQNSLRDLRALAAPLENLGRKAFALWVNAANAAFAVIVSFDVYVVQTPDLKEAISSTPHGMWFLLGLNLVATLAARRVSPAHA